MSGIAVALLGGLVVTLTAGLLFGPFGTPEVVLSIVVGAGVTAAARRR